MKITICDPCATEQKIFLAKYQTKHRTGVKIMLCADHKDWARDKTPEQYLETIIEAEEMMRKEMGAK